MQLPSDYLSGYDRIFVPVGFYRPLAYGTATAYVDRNTDIAILSVCLSVRPSRTRIVLKRLNRSLGN